ncbi:TPA: hypothetical protein N0F65_004121 [Lagenidium giganteum]|uniref:Uncharacterized protein n=1 Tax=Lagenidium giganteum TaxID=4803 RepID=A0AAV2ZER4_9STRA|nr:TPA: hypothetical protein N0F65_004121 [Lagenidium giganteum]
MDLREDDTEARVLNYFILFDQIVEENGLESMLGSGLEQTPEMLKLEIGRLAIARPALKEDEILLYETLVERAREQQHFHLLSMELKETGRNNEGGKSKKDAAKGDTPAKNGKKGSTNPPDELKRKPTRIAPQTPRKPPRDGCLLCGGAHWVSECDASQADKDEALRKAREKKEQLLAEKTDPSEDDDDIPADDIVGVSNADEGMERINAMLEEALNEGFPAEYMDAVRTETKAALDLWRTKLGADPPAKMSHFASYSSQMLCLSARRHASTRQSRRSS